MTQRERMDAGLLYDPNSPEIISEQAGYLETLRRFNLSDASTRAQMLPQMLGRVGKNCYIEAPFYANWGGSHVFFGDNVYANFCLTAVDDGNIYVGDNVLFGPNVTLATAGHPVNPELRSKSLQYNRDIHIGDNAWIGAGTVVLPGVTIGENSVIGAGSIVTKDIPANCVAVGNPCRVVREIGAHDDEYYYKGEKIDWENLK